MPLSGKNKYRWIGYIAVSSYFGWFVLSAWSHKPVEILSRYLPGRFATEIYASWLVLTPIILLIKSETLRTSLVLFLLASGMLLPVAMRFFPLATFLIFILFLIELYLLIPLSKSLLKRVKEV
jgi:hypothetical protein